MAKGGFGASKAPPFGGKGKAPPFGKGKGKGNPFAKGPAAMAPPPPDAMAMKKGGRVKKAKGGRAC
jgi:hypothetical protein